MIGYRALAAVYDRLMTADYSAVACRLLEIFARFGASSQTLLDLGCGSGKLIRELESCGRHVIGVDGSPEMLALAAERTETLLLCQDMRELDLLRTVDGAVCTMDGFNHLLNIRDIAKALSRLRLFISPGGLFIFDVNTVYKHREILGNRCFVLEQPGLICTWQNRYAPKRHTVNMWLDFFEETDNGLYRRTSDEVTERAYSLHTWKRLLEQADFTLLAAYDGFEDQPPRNTSERVILVARNDRPKREFMGENS